MVAEGLTVIEAVVAPVLHRNDVPPDAVSVDEPPLQNEGLVEVILQSGGVESCVTVNSAKQLLAGLIVS